PYSEYDSNDAVEFTGFCDFVGIDTVTYDDVVMAIKEFKSISTIGIDNIPPFIIKGCVPYAWKLTKIVPVFKKGSAKECKNYRPIAILSPIS
ncbi:hypothetical protein AVEN_78288-1, partial [Araneus ventricosus]